jgi:membrane protein
MYGAFGVPVALLLWINFTAKLLLYSAAWTATGSLAGAEGEDADEEADAGAQAGPEVGSGRSAAEG